MELLPSKKSSTDNCDGNYYFIRWSNDYIEMAEPDYGIMEDRELRIEHSNLMRKSFPDDNDGSRITMMRSKLQTWLNYMWNMLRVNVLENPEETRLCNSLSSYVRVGVTGRYALAIYMEMFDKSDDPERLKSVMKKDPWVFDLMPVCYLDFVYSYPLPLGTILYERFGSNTAIVFDDVEIKVGSVFTRTNFFITSWHPEGSFATIKEYEDKPTMLFVHRVESEHVHGFPSHIFHICDDDMDITLIPKLVNRICKISKMDFPYRQRNGIYTTIKNLTIVELELFHTKQTIKPLCDTNCLA